MCVYERWWERYQIKRRQAKIYLYVCVCVYVGGGVKALVNQHYPVVKLGRGTF